MLRAPSWFWFRDCQISLLILSEFNSLSPTPQNGQTHSNNSLKQSDELFECVWPFCVVGAWRVSDSRKVVVKY